jgi:hypothetical protein
MRFDPLPEALFVHNGKFAELWNDRVAGWAGTDRAMKSAARIWSLHRMIG